MSLFKVFSVLFLCTSLFIGLAACGFQPLYVQNDGNGGTQLVPLDDITINNIPDRSGQYLRNVLVDRIYLNGYPQSPRYQLNVIRLNENITQLGIRRDASATRAQMRLTAQMQLLDRQNNVIILTRNLIATNSYNILDSQYTTNVSTDYARERALEELARQIVTELSLYFQRNEGHTTP